MLIKRLYLRNFRVYEDELELDLPPGLVGIYGPNGAGKSTLLEAILFTLWGPSACRTTKDQIRSAGVGGDCVTEVEFEHEGHLYLVRRTLKGAGATVSTEAYCDGALMSAGNRDAGRYVESVLGMDDGAFRASVFTEQKQLAAFSNQSPADRRRLVLQLLGITPLDGARDAARKDARELTADHDRLRGMLPQLEALETEADDSRASAEAAEIAASDEAGAAQAAADRGAQAAAAFDRLDLRRQEHEALVIEGRAARQDLELAEKAAAGIQAELAELDGLEARLEILKPQAAGLAGDERKVEALAGAAAAAAAAERILVPDRPTPVDEAALGGLAAAAAARREQLAATRALLSAAESDLNRARQVAEKSESLSGEAECPVCGQALGAAFAAVQAHRAAETAEAEQRCQALQADLERLAAEARQAEAALSQASEAAEEGRRLMAEWERAHRRRQDADQALAEQWEAVGRAGADTPGAEPVGAPGAPSAGALAAAVEEGRAALAAKRAAEAEVLTIRGRLETRARLQRGLAESRDRAGDAAGRVEALREKVRALGFVKADLDRAAGLRDAAATAARDAEVAAQQAAIRAAQEGERARAAAQRLADGRAQHAKLAELDSEARHRARVADLLSEFRNTVVASVGPRLAAQAADLFGELTDHEYERIEVDPDTYQLQISDGGRLYGLDRFSGSEIDLANLALRVAISEHIHFQSGGSVGLLVLDEVFGPLDEDRKTRMLLALERLRGRFRQVLVVTHDPEIKDQLPTAVEVLKRPGRRATARLLGD